MIREPVVVASVPLVVGGVPPEAVVQIPSVLRRHDHPVPFVQELTRKRVAAIHPRFNYIPAKVTSFLDKYVGDDYSLKQLYMGYLVELENKIKLSTNVINIGNTQELLCKDKRRI